MSSASRVTSGSPSTGGPSFPVGSDSGATASESAAPLLQVRGLEVAYGPITAIHGVSFEVPAGRIVTLIGSNGAGKTTLLRTISGMLGPRQGQILYQGQPIAGIEAHLLVRRGLCHCPEGRGVFPSLTVRENLEMGGYIMPRRVVQENMERAFSLFPRLRERVKQAAGTLSGGEQQMLAIGRALMANPRLLLLDEPSLGLAPQIVMGIFRIIREINAQGTAVLLVEQNARMALQIAHTGYVLETGRITLQGTGHELLLNPSVQGAYLGGH